MNRIILVVRTLIVGTACVFMIKNCIGLLKIGGMETSIIIAHFVATVTMVVIFFEPLVRHFFSKEHYILVLGILASVLILIMLFLPF